MKLSIVVPICNTDYAPAHYTGDCIGSVNYFTYTPKEDREIIVIDNASTCELGGLKWEDVVDVHVKNEENLGVPKAWNQGIKLAKGEYIAVLNSDVQVYEFWDVLMMDSLEHVDLVMATPMYDKPFGRAAEAKKIRQEIVDRGDSPDQFLQDFADFSCFMLKRETVEKVGMFDEEYGLGYGEDVDYRLRMERMGMVCKSDKRVATHHVGMATGYTLGNQGVELGETMNKNKEYTKQKHGLDEYNIPEWKREKIEAKVETTTTSTTSSTTSSVSKYFEKVLDDGSFVARSKSTGDKVFLMRLDKTRSWVMNPETLVELGFGFQNVKIISDDEMESYSQADSMDLKQQHKENNKPQPIDPATVNPILGYRKNA